jgi:DNA-binding Lrp family transcriptional regulator
MAKPHQLDRIDRLIIDKIHHSSVVGTYPPTVQELADHIIMSQTAVWFRLKWLRENGYVTNVPNLARTHKVTKKGLAAL